MILLTGFYGESDPARCEEFLECLRRNRANPCVREVHVFLETPVAPELFLVTHPCLAAEGFHLHPYGQRLTFSELFRFADRFPAGTRVIVANADIYFDETLALLDAHDLTGRLLCLSRWDAQPDGSLRRFDHAFSQDAWIFQAPIRPFPCDFSLGLPGCDNRLAGAAKEAGLRLQNPSQSIRACHLHLSPVRHYSERDRIRGAFAPVPPSLLPAGTTPTPASR